MKLDARLQRENKEKWSIVERLAGMPEPERRRLLRPHAEMRFGDDPQGREDRELRRQLDVALGALTAFEIGCQVGIVSDAEKAPEAENLKKLFASEAFLRFVNAYLYFGNRFLGWRIDPPEWSSGVQKERSRDRNDRPLALMTPPTLPSSGLVETSFAELMNLSTNCDPAIQPKDSSNKVRALTFLDGFTDNPPEHPGDISSEAERFELWLRGLYQEPDDEDYLKAKRDRLGEWTDEEYFKSIRDGLKEWAIERCKFYLSLKLAESPESPPANESNGKTKKKRPVEGWAITDPFAARFALADVYWISRLLRADVSANASVTYSGHSWLRLLTFRGMLDGEGSDAAFDLQKAEEVLRSVFDFVCDLVQNAVEITEEKEKEAYDLDLVVDFPPKTVKWRKVFDEELNEIEEQRKRRAFNEKSHQGATGSSAGGDAGNGGNTGAAGDDDWMERIRRNRRTRNLVGLSFSGGGIRSATFNLGVLQGLQELDLLRQIDYLSTVSGGGFIGSWLVANVCRTRHWLGRLMNWEDSIDHLRRYSNYLAPRLGMFSADTWSMWASWARNAFLIQLTGLVWLWAALLAALLGEKVFLWGDTSFAGVLAPLLMFPILGTLLYNLSGDRAVSGKPSFKGWSSRLVWILGVLPAWLASFLLASLMWAQSDKLGCTVDDLIRLASVIWADAKSLAFCKAISDLTTDPAMSHRGLFLWPGIIWVALGLVAFFTLSQTRSQYAPFVRVWHAAWISFFSVVALGLELWGVLALFIYWSGNYVKFSWYAFVLGPPLVLTAHTMSVVLFIGFCGRHSKEAIREWWTRFGAVLAMFGAGYLALTTSAVFGPHWTLRLYGTIKWGSIITVIAGLLAGKSSKTSGNGAQSKSPWLERLAKLGGFVFILGALLAASTALYVVLAKIGGPPETDWTDYWKTLLQIPWYVPGIALLAALLCGFLFSRFFEINIFGLNQFYRFRLVRCYLGAARWAPGFRKPQPFINFDGTDDMKLSEVLIRNEKNEGYRGPFPIFNCALNLRGSSDLALHTRHSASFSLTPLRCGADRRRVGYADTTGFARGVMLGQAVAISGAAASPNMGFNTSPLVAFLLTMFNVRLGWWFPNPGREKWDRPGLSFSLYYLLLELFGVADEKSKFVNVSDGGHFENLGLYELVRRRCKVIIVSDAECDEFLQFGSLGNVVRLSETDFGAKIDINVSSIRQQKDGFSLAHCNVGTIIYSNGSIGHLIYLKASISGDEDVGVTQYRSVHPSFPHETTADQFFSEDQFESYRRLGRHIVRVSFRGTQPGDQAVSIAEKLSDVLAPVGCSSETFLQHTKTLDGIWERFRQSPKLHPFFEELIQQTVAPAVESVPHVHDEEMIIGLELIQLMENVFLDLRLDDFWLHPDNRGWAILFMRWARSPRFRAIWKRTRRTFGIRFEYFCEARLGLSRDNPIVRV
jgi:hypothetical protein